MITEVAMRTPLTKYDTWELQQELRRRNEVLESARLVKAKPIEEVYWADVYNKAIQVAQDFVATNLTQSGWPQTLWDLGPLVMDAVFGASWRDLEQGWERKDKTG